MAIRPADGHPVLYDRDRPRPGANQTGAGSPIATQQAAQEDTRMTYGVKMPALGGVDAGRYQTAAGTRYVAKGAPGRVGLRACAISEQERASLADAHCCIGAVSPVSSSTSSTRGGAR